MKFSKFATIAASMAVVFSAYSVMARAEPTVKIAAINELSGAGAISGTNFSNGVKMAVAQINAAGGILGRKIDLSSYDTQSNPGIASALIRRAAGDDAYAVLGPGFSGSVIVSMKQAELNKIPDLVGAEANNISAQGNQYIFRTSLDQAQSMPSVAAYMTKELHAKKVAVVWVNNDFGKDGRDSIRTNLEKDGAQIVTDIPEEQGQIDFTSAILKIKESKADSLFLYLNEDGAARFLVQLRKFGFDGTVVGQSSLANPSVIALAKSAANGVYCQVGLTTADKDPLVQKFIAQYESLYHSVPDQNSFKGYIAMQTVAAATQKLGKFDRQALANELHHIKLSAKQYPGILYDLSYEPNGNILRKSFMVQVQNGQQVIVKEYPASAAKG
ncbi:MAG: ABC transporter substrate-binding protein [Betaproteobacteria bacterium]|nr:ABC transporter substrate-binding protein [Betaproteobacteria bacterium]MDE2124775.1 ABC transporter substrate-binding protein [Betaproteobacteria bacterium]MDE2185798.1 ABC transporter substrate-binding protein [Betaproteobacteria bacterium]MDE2324547.1 ABC transporter substrate-binding protein [Betaproteobacteria bacterium]